MADDGTRWGTLAEVAGAYGVSVDTIRRRMKRGELETRRQQTPQGFKWLAVMPGLAPTGTAQDTPGSPRTNDRGEQGATVVPDRDVLLETLQRELELRNREITRLHEVVAYQAQAIERATAALPATTLRPRGEQPELTPQTSKTGARDEERDDHDGHRETVWERFRRWFTG